MPYNYAHYRFGVQMLPLLSPEVQKVVKRNRQMYDIGLHGPDIFFYHNILKRDDVGRYASHLHGFSGQVLFTRLAKRLRLSPSEPAMAYLFGLLTHYCLDSHCHPMINAASAVGTFGHVQLETEFDRHLMVLDGKTPPSTHFTGAHIRVTDAEAAVIAEFYTGVTTQDVKRSVANMAQSAKLLAMPQSPVRTVLDRAIRGSGHAIREFIMTDQPDPACAHLDEGLMGLYEAAATAFPELARQLTAYLSCGVPLGDEFMPTFG